MKKRKVRVLQVIDILGPGGAEMLILTMAAGIDRSRFELHACALREIPGFVQADVLRGMGVPVLQLQQRNSYDIPALLGIVRYVRKHKIDIIHTHLTAADIMGRMAGFLTRRPVVSTIHNSRADLDLEPKRRQMLQRWTARLMCRRLVIVSKMLHAETAEWFGLPGNKVVAIPNGVDTERFRPRPDLDRAALKRELVGGDYPMIASVGRMVPQKGQTYLLEAARKVFDRRPDARLLLLGDGEERSSLEAKAEELGITGNVLFPGYRNDIPDCLAASDVFVLSSLWEGLPVALLEAMSARCASVATAVGGVPEVVQEEVTGLLVPPEDPLALAGALLRLLDDPSLAQRMGAAAQRHAEKHYSMKVWVGKLQELYLRELGLSRRIDS